MRGVVQAAESKKAGQWFTAAFHLRLLALHAPDDAWFAARLTAAEAKLHPELAPRLHRSESVR